jgi:hypothetical protein
LIEGIQEYEFAVYIFAGYPVDENVKWIKAVIKTIPPHLAEDYVVFIRNARTHATYLPAFISYIAFTSLFP